MTELKNSESKIVCEGVDRQFACEYLYALWTSLVEALEVFQRSLR